jgi:hypothetical protein
MAAKVPVKMLTHISGVAKDSELLPGETYLLEPKYAGRLIATGQAEPVSKNARRETTTRESRETAVDGAAERR